MTLKEAAELLEMSTNDLIMLGEDPKALPTLISLAYNKGLLVGQEQAHAYYHKLITGETTPQTKTARR